MAFESLPEVPTLLEGGLSTDDRGSVGFVNDFGFAGVKRFYTVTNHAAGFVRAWHAHRHEAKYVTVIQGAAIVAAVRIDDWEHPSAALVPTRYVMSASRPAVLFIPAGYANGSMSLTADAKLMFFSTATVKDSMGDDVRIDARFWDPWQVVER